MIGTHDAKTRVRHLRLVHLAATVEKTNAERVDMIPVGIDSKEDCLEVKPKFLMITALKVVSPARLLAYFAWTNSRSELYSYLPPLGMLMAMLRKKMIHVFGSSRASLA